MIYYGFKSIAKFPRSNLKNLGFANGMAQVIKSLFANNEQGFAFDFNDLSTMYQDAAGTIPVTGVGQPVGLVLDKSKGVTYSENLVNISNQQALLSQATLDDGWWDIARTTSNFPGISQIGLKTNSLYKVKVSWKVSIATPIRIEFNSTSGYIFLTIYATNDGSWEGYINSIEKTQLNVYFRDVTNAGYCGSIKIDRIHKVSGNHAIQTTSAKRPILQKNATTGAYYLSFDGVDDFLVTGNVDFSSGDKVSLFVGLTKKSNTASQITVELSTGTNINNGSFGLAAPSATNASDYQPASRGTTRNLVSSASNYTPPSSNVLTVQAAISTPLLTIAVNKVAISTSSAIQGTGNYGNYPLYIGMRAGTSLPFTGDIYSLISIARLATLTEIINTENAIAKNVGVTL